MEFIRREVTGNFIRHVTREFCLNSIINKIVGGLNSARLLISMFDRLHKPALSSSFLPFPSDIVIFSRLITFSYCLIEMGNNKRERRQRARLARAQMSAASPTEKAPTTPENEQPTSSNETPRPQMNQPLPKTLHVEPVITQYFPSDKLKDMLKIAKRHHSRGETATALKLYQELYPLAEKEQGLNDLFTLGIVGALTTLYCDMGDKAAAWEFLMSRGPDARCG